MLSSFIEFHRSCKYSEFLDLQKKRNHEDRPGILLAELSPVITLGRRAGVPAVRARDLPHPASWYSQRGVEILETDRGGLATWHGPGQWVLFPVLPGVRPEVKKITRQLLNILQATVENFGVDAQCRSGEELGLWQGSQKIGALGIRLSREGLTHGIALGVFKTPGSFEGLRPCGLDAPVGYLFAEEAEGQKQFQNVGQTLAEIAQSALF